MFINRVKQFFIQLTDTMTQDDYVYAQKYLTSEEYKIFNKLSKIDQKHCIRVAKGLEILIIDQYKDRESKYAKEDIIKYIRLGLLHDLGKSFKKINIINKSSLVILNSITKGKLKNFTKIKSIDCYYNHGEKGYDILKQKCEDNEFLNAIRYHHNKEYYSTMVKLLRYIDDEN